MSGSEEERGDPVEKEKRTDHHALYPVHPSGSVFCSVQLEQPAELRDGDDLADYGLDEASRITVEAVYTEDEEEKALTLYIGDEDEDGNRYVMINDSRIVYLISDEVCQNILNC